MAYNIIAQVTADIKLRIELAEEKAKNLSQTKDGTFDARYGAKWTAKKQDSRKMASRLREIGELSRAERMNQCAEIVTGKVCQKCGQMHVTYCNLCRDRVCPLCAWRLSMQRYAQMYDIITTLRDNNPDKAWQFVTLTCQNCAPEQLGGTLDEMSRAWNAITTSRKTRDMIAGWARAVEVTYNHKTGLMHPHYHIIVIYKDCITPNAYIVDRWLRGLKITCAPAGQDHRTINWFDDADNERDIGAILELYKYTIKGNDLLDMPIGAFWAVTRALSHRRLISYGGIIKQYIIDNRIDLDTAQQEDDSHTLDKCVSCKSRDLIEILGTWCGADYMWRRLSDNVNAG